MCLSVGGVLRDAGENAGEHPQSGEAEPGVYVGAIVTLGDTMLGGTYEQNLGGPWREGQGRENSASQWRGHPEAISLWSGTGFWEGSCLKNEENIKNRTPQQGGWGAINPLDVGRV